MLDARRDWLTGNILRATDEYSYSLAANMTSLVRSNFAIDDRVNKAWFVNPGNRWNVPMSGGYQSDLLLSDKLILVAVVTLNDGAGNVLRRRLMSFSTFSSSASDSPSQPQVSLFHSADMPGGGGGGDGRYVSVDRRLLQSSSPDQQQLQEYVSVPLQPAQADADAGTVQVRLSFLHMLLRI